MSCKTVDINGETYVRHDLVPEKQGSYVIVRCSGAGVHAGYEKERTDNTVTLTDAIRLWKWHGRTLNGLALEGPDIPSQCKFGPAVPEITLNGWHEIICCTHDATEKLQAVEGWKND